MGVLLLSVASTTAAQFSPGPLSRAHTELEGVTQCTKCHPLGRKTMDVACLDCHREIAWLEDQERGLHGQVAGSKCSECHPEHAGEAFDLVDFDDPEDFRHERAGWPLDGAHRKIECEKCHREELWTVPARSLREKASDRLSYLGLDRRCVSCHVDDHEQQLGLDCSRCHGNDTFQPAPSFRHDSTSFPLVGQHATVACVKCHATVDPAGKSFTFPARNVQQCSACHKDPHRGSLGPRCTDCHGEIGWKASVATTFDHAKTRFALVGAHSKVSCDRCHDEASGGWGAKPSFSTCGSCHVDPHRAADGTALLAGDCSACHGEQSFQPSRFDVARHAKTDFPLRGAHASLRCRQCHQGEPTRLADTLGLWWQHEDSSCASCHADAHGEALARLHETEATCESCHDEQRWKPSLYTAKQHDQARFALRGAHLEPACARCHGADRTEMPAPPDVERSGKARIVFALEETKCADCHHDPHDAGSRSADCQDCHGTRRWVPVELSVEDHARFAMRLDGSHAALPCIDCHSQHDGRSNAGTSLLRSANRQSLPFSTRTRGCRDCHSAEQLERTGR